MAAISQVGVPTAVCAYSLIVLNRTMKEVKEALVDVKIALVSATGKAVD
jgi:hypothetical protein